MGIGKYIQGFSLKDYSEIAFISMNELGIERVEIKKNNKVEILELDSSDPFAIVLSKSAENITAYCEANRPGLRSKTAAFCF